MKRSNFTARIYRTAKENVKYVLLTWIEDGKLMMEKVIFRAKVASKQLFEGKYLLGISEYENSIRMMLVDNESLETIPLQCKVLGFSTKL